MDQSGAISAKILMIRHGPTAWNTHHIIQGRRDIELSPEGRARVAAWTIPSDFTDAQVFSSPLSRALETAKILMPQKVPIVDDRLIEMDWGQFEGKTLDGLRAKSPDMMAANEAKGYRFQPPGGETPLSVSNRLHAFLLTLRHDSIVVTHKGVMRALMILACDWQMTSKPPIKLGLDDGLIFELVQRGAVTSSDDQVVKPPVIANLRKLALA